ncbi:MAG TPA: S8 family serine peptidase, partial [Anaerolineaceae bacterium]|nr:S8 family serine peptidase [Anaerolineaceae bacterium]
MRNKTLYSLFALVLLAGMVFSLVQPASAMVKPAAQGLDKVEPAVLNTISAKGASDYVVEMAEKADLSAAYEIEDWTERGWFVYDTLKETAARTQQPVIELLKAGGVSYQSFFAGNEIAVTGGDLNSLSAIAALPGVSHIRYPRTVSVEPFSLKTADVTVPTPDALDWGISDTGADDFWSTFGFQGDGIVVANVDTGVQWDHPALDQSFKCGTDPSDPACWADPSNICGGSACDNNGHGTHTMGTMVGDDDPSLTYQVGMAPNAQWIACKGCETNSCSDTSLNACADWIVAPDGDPANRPNVVNNSWGGGSGDDWYLAKVNAWRAAGIFPAFSAGNNYSCNSLGSPGDYQESFATASHTSSRTISDFSSKGPSAFGDDPYTKPNISAPGSNICSTVPGSGWNCGYSGTSMASPHTAGAVALLWSCNPSLIGDMATTFELLQDTADTPPPGSCGAPADGEGNYTFGYGYLNVLTAGNQVCSSGSLAGFVYDATSMAPVEGATVTADNGGGIVVDTTTLADGSYLMNLPEGTYDVSATKYGYTTDLVTGIVIVEGGLVTQDFYIDLLGMTTVSGYVTDGGVEGLGLHGYPLYSSIHITATGFDETLYVDPFTGYYEIELVEETDHTFVTTAVPSGYDVLTETVTPTGATYAHDIELMADGEACAAPGYQPDYDIFYSFEGSDEGFTPGGTTSFAWGDFTSGPGEGHSGTKGIATNPAGNYNANELGWMASPVIDLTGFGTSTPVIQWYDWKDIESVSWDWARVDVTKDGGVTWFTVWGPVGGVTDTAYEQQTVVLDPTYNVANFQFRFYFKSDSSVQYEGWYVDDIGIIAAPVPPPTTVWSSNFDTDNGGFTVSGTTSFAWGAPTSGPGAPYSAPNVWATNLAGNYNSSESGWITSPVIDLSAHAGLAPTISFWHWNDIESTSFDWGAVEVTRDGGTTWTDVSGKIGDVSPWSPKSIQLDPTYAVSNFQFRFYFRSDSSVNYAGWYIDDVAVSVAEEVVVAAPCVVVPGGVVAGYVYDDNTLEPLTGAGVVSDTGAAGTTFAIPEETEGFYWIFQPATVTALAAAPVPAAISGGGSTSALTTSGGSVAVAPVTAPPAVNAILWDQPLSAVSTAAYVNQEFSDYPDFSSFLADDFVAADPWTITSLFIPGDGWNGFSSLLNATALNFQIYADNAGIPAGYPGGGAPVWSLSVPPTDLQVTLTTGSGGYLSNATLTPAAPINLPPGHYWLVYYPTMSFGSYGQFGRQPADTTNGYVGQFINPGGGFGYGTAWQPWTVIGPTQQDIAFRIEGMAITSEFHDFTASMDKYMDDTETVEVMMNAITQQDFYLGAGWLEFDPESLEVTMMMGDAPLTETLTISNLGDADAIIEISEKDEGYLPPLHIPAFTGTLPEDTRPVSMGPAPDAKPMPLSAAGALRNLLAGEPATAIDIYPGENLVHIPDTTVPGYWDIVGSVGGTQFFAGDFTGGDFSTLYVADYGNNNLYAVDTATAVYTLIGPTTPPAGQTFSGLTGTPDGMLYGLTTSCSSSNLVTVDPETGATTNLGALGPIACGIDLAYNTENDLIYIVDLITDHLFSVDPATLAVVDIGSLGASANYAQGMDYEEETGILYWAAYTGSGELRVIDMTTGASALVGGFPGGAETDCLAFETGGGADVPWLSEDPVSGTVPAMDDLVVDVTFDPTGAGLGQPGDY